MQVSRSAVLVCEHLAKLSFDVLRQYSCQQFVTLGIGVDLVNQIRRESKHPDVSSLKYRKWIDDIDVQPPRFLSDDRVGAEIRVFGAAELDPRDDQDYESESSFIRESV